MALLKRINTKAKADKNTVFGTNANSYGGRFINKNGTANVKKSGMHILHRISWYDTLIDMPRWKFMFILLSFLWDSILFLRVFITPSELKIWSESIFRVPIGFSLDKLIFLVHKHLPQ